MIIGPDPGEVDVPPPPKGEEMAQQPITKKTALRMNQIRARCIRLFIRTSFLFAGSCSNFTYALFIEKLRPMRFQYFV
jgi:hypothetical protein